MKALTVGSLFSGIGGLELGLERAGMKTVWQVEKDEYARRVLRKHWPEIALYDDVEDVGYWRNGKLAPVDLICGGFPCQDISVAGNGAGLGGARSGLWSEFRRIIDEGRPSWVVIENVPALRSRGLGVVLGDLSEIGFDAIWDGFSAHAFGAAHRRDRIFIIAYPQRESLRLKSWWRGREAWKGATKSGFVSEAWRSPEPRSRAFEPPVCGGADGLPHRLDRLRCLGNAVVPQIAEHVGRLIMETYK